MAKKDIKFTLDTIDSRYSPVGTVKQLDSVFFYIKITENGVTKDLTGQTIKLFAIKEDKKIVEQTTKINITNPREGLVEIELLNAAIQVHGFTYFELEISDYNGIISTSDFILRVNKRVGSDEAIESTNEVATLKKIEEYVAQAKVELQKFKELQTEMLKTNETINSQESLRVSAEAERVNSESARVVAEEGRVAAETQREEAFSGFEGRITANTEELETARTATTGETFNNLDERIDAEVERINKNIEISFLEQVDKESHVIENTVEGMTKDVIVKGRTLLNLSNLGEQEFITETAKYISVKTDLFKPSTKYTFIAEIKDDEVINAVDKTQYLRIDENGVILGGFVGDVTTHYKLIAFTFVTQEKVTDLIKINQRLAIGRKQYLKNVIFLEGDWTNKKIPIYFEGIKSFGEQEGNISSFSNGENLLPNFNNSNWQKNKTDGLTITNSTVFGTPTDPGFGLKYKIYLKANTYYSCKAQKWEGANARIRLLDKYKNIVHAQIQNKNEISLPQSDYYYISVENKGELTQIEIGEIMFSQSATVNEYVDYKENKKDIPLSALGFTEGLRGINSDVCDELNSTKNMAIKKIEKLVVRNLHIAGIEDRPNATNTNWFQTSVISGIDVKEGSLNINNKFVSLTEREVWKDSNDFECISITGSTSGARIKGRINKGVSQEQLKEKLEGLTIYYELSEPLETPLDTNITLKIFKKKSYINFENALSGTISFKAPVNTLATISRLNRENKVLEEENKNLRQDLESTTLALTDSDLELVKQNVDMDFRLMEVEFALDIPQAILSSDIKFKNKKGEVKSMARTPYEMMKIVILSGDYDREDYMHKVGKYYERGRMTKEEHDELMSLMTADEVLSK